ncbi:F-box protein At3g07870-like [Papaver somniferum]|uniref:F-box protein At3g07870-like n=1 Tax=Papaver somniferum TaxID=3469 RepID=UPI000E700AFD|nr:F-box protein At3g07870-like [Papaver somniferum]
MSTLGASPKLQKQQVGGGGEAISSLPEELYHEILVRLPVKSLLTCYNALLSRMYNEFDFSVFSMDYLSFKYTRLSDVGSCNGLVVIWSYQKTQNITCLWNPATKEYKLIPKSSNANKKSVMHAFGYDDKTCAYKVVNVYKDVENISFGEVYTFGSNSWESIQAKPYSFRNKPKCGVLLNGVFHWLGKMCGCSVIVSLDVSHKEFKNLKLPKETLEKNLSFICVGILQNSLYVIVGVQCGFDVWVMQNYGVQESWGKRYNITNRSRFLRGLFFYNYGEILLLSSRKLTLYHPKNGIAGEANDLTVFLYGVNYVESLVSLNSGT